MDNESYHSVLEKPPTQSWRRDKIIAWLQEKKHFQRELSKPNYCTSQQPTCP
jgi:hypothetical protein